MSQRSDGGNSPKKEAESQSVSKISDKVDTKTDLTKTMESTKSKKMTSKKVEPLRRSMTQENRFFPDNLRDKDLKLEELLKHVEKASILKGDERRVLEGVLAKIK